MLGISAAVAAAAVLLLPLMLAQTLPSDCALPPVLPDRYAFTQTFTDNGVQRAIYVALDKKIDAELRGGVAAEDSLMLTVGEPRGGVACTYTVTPINSTGQRDLVCTAQTCETGDSCTATDPIPVGVLTTYSGQETIDGVLCDRFDGGVLEQYSLTAWFVSGTGCASLHFSHQVTTMSGEVMDFSFSDWTTDVPSDAFAVSTNWNCTGPPFCLP